MATKKSTGVPAAPPSLQIGGGRVLRLVPRHTRPELSDDALETIAVLEQLLRDARAGKLDGLAYMAIGTDRVVVGDVVGMAYHDPVLARGALCGMDDALGALCRDGAA